MEEQRHCQKISLEFSSEPNQVVFETMYQLKLCQDTLREILVESDVIQLNKMLAEGVLLERVIKHFFQVKMDEKSFILEF